MEDVILGIFVYSLIWVLPLTLTLLKGKYGLAAVGILFHLCWWFGAIRLAKPNSFWARRFYDSDKMRLVNARFPEDLRERIPAEPT